MHSFHWPLAITASVFALAITANVFADDSPSNFSLAVDNAFGPANGFVQVPSGGEPGSTSSHRPRLGEMGINQADQLGVTATQFIGANDLFLAGTWQPMSGSATLAEPLTTHGRFFDAGTHVSSDLTIGTLAAGYGRRFEFGKDGEWSVAPTADVELFDLRYRLHGGGESASRSFIKPTVQVGGALAYTPGRGPVSIELSAAYTPNISSLAETNRESLVARYRVLQRGSMAASVSAGVAFEQVRFEDNQTVSNHVKINEGPMLIIGARVDF